MKQKLHPATQKAVNRYAQGYLSLYRASRSSGTDKNTARWQARMSMSIRTKNGNIYAIVNARSFRYDNARKNYQKN